MNVDFSSPLNLGVVRHLQSGAAASGAVSIARSTASCAPGSVDDPYYHLGTHPDLVGWFWDELPAKLPKTCKWVVFGSPVLVHPRFGVIFGFAGGTHTYALRLPPQEKAAAIKAGCKRVRQYPAYPELNIQASQLNLDDLGDEWVFGQFLPCEKEWCLAAYEFAGHAAKQVPD